MNIGIINMNKPNKFQLKTLLHNLDGEFKGHNVCTSVESQRLVYNFELEEPGRTFHIRLFYRIDIDHSPDDMLYYLNLIIQSWVDICNGWDSYRKEKFIVDSIIAKYIIDNYDNSFCEPKVEVNQDEISRVVHEFIINHVKTVPSYDFLDIYDICALEIPKLLFDKEKYTKPLIEFSS